MQNPLQPRKGRQCRKGEEGEKVMPPSETAVDRVRFLRAQACYYGLDGADNLRRYSDEDLASIYNGIGPEWFSEKLRRFMDKLHPDMRCIALVHDVEFHEGDGSREKFTAANRRLRTNGHKVAKAKYKWYNPMRYWIMWESSRFDNLCQAFGWGAYQEACRRCAEVKSIRENNERKNNANSQ